MRRPQTPEGGHQTHGNRQIRVPALPLPHDREEEHAAKCLVKELDTVSPAASSRSIRDLTSHDGDSMPWYEACIANFSCKF